VHKETLLAALSLKIWEKLSVFFSIFSVHPYDVSIDFVIKTTTDLKRATGDHHRQTSK